MGWFGRIVCVVIGCINSLLFCVSLEILFLSSWLAISAGGLLCSGVAVVALLDAACWDPIYCLAIFGSHLRFGR